MKNTYFRNNRINVGIALALAGILIVSLMMTPSFEGFTETPTTTTPPSKLDILKKEVEDAKLKEEQLLEEFKKSKLEAETLKDKQTKATTKQLNAINNIQPANTNLADINRLLNLATSKMVLNYTKLNVAGNDLTKKQFALATYENEMKLPVGSITV